MWKNIFFGAFVKLNLHTERILSELSYDGSGVAGTQIVFIFTNDSFHFQLMQIKEIAQGTCFSDSTCLDSAIGKPNLR